MVSKELAEIINVLDDTNKIVLKGSDEDKKQKLKECFDDVVIRSFGKEFKSLEEYEEYMKKDLENVSIQDLIDNYDRANERKEKAKLEFEKLNGIGDKELTDKELFLLALDNLSE